MKEWFKAAGIRAIKTIAQTAIATIKSNKVRSATRLIATHTGMAILNISSFILRQITAIRH